MSCTVDHLRPQLRVRVLQDFTDARGAQHRAGEQAVIHRLQLDWRRQELIIEWEQDRKPEILAFALAAKTGPRNGHMREFFAEEGSASPIVEPAALTRRRRTPPAVPPLTSEWPIADPGRYDEALQRLWALAARRRFDEAEEQIRVILAAPDPYGGVLEGLADDMVGLAVAHADEEDRSVYDWLRQRSIQLWYAWGSGATSGGEGTVRAQRIRAAEARLAE